MHIDLINAPPVHNFQNHVKLIDFGVILLIILFLLFLLWFRFCGYNILRDQYRQNYLKIEQGNQQHVYKDYNKIADWFDKNRSRVGYEKKYLDMVFDVIPQGGAILDLGCGMAEPVTEYLIKKGYTVTGVEGSQKLMNMACNRYPKTEFIHADMRLIDLNRKFDAIILWHSFFHLPWQDQRKMFSLFAKHLKSGGILLFTSGSEEGEVWSNNGGIDLYHASLSMAEYKQLLQEHHFKLLLHVIEDPSCGDATVWIAQYFPSIHILE